MAQLTPLCVGTGATPQLGVMPAPEAISSVAMINTSSGPAPQPMHTVMSPSHLAVPVSLPSVAHTSGPPYWNPGQFQGMILSPALQPIPARLVRRIQAGEFIEMRDLLTDNIALHDQLEAVQGPLYNAATPGALRARLREVPSLISWVFCFTAYMAVRTQDEATRDMLTYCRLVIREALRHGGQGWQEYDRNFRAQAAIDRSLRWNVLLPDLQAATTLGQRIAGGNFCSLCRGIDHASGQCALGVMQQPLSWQSRTTASTAATEGGRRPSQRRVQRICSSWNSGRCIYPGNCSYRHVCATCFQHIRLESAARRHRTPSISV